MKKIFFLGLVVSLGMVSCQQEESVGPVAGINAAKEIGSGAGGGGTTCSPISSLLVKANVKVGELGVGAVDMTYSVKPCDKNQTVTVTVQILNWKTGEVVYEQTNASLSGKASFLGTRYYEIYQGKVIVYDAATGAQIASQGMSVAMTPKGV
ncbi:MAG: hypothetical protein U0Y10_24280 [Spirosomataceae bacterium]